MMNNLNTELSDHIKLLRFKSKLSQDEVAKILNISRNTYNNWENNPIQLNLDTLEKIGKVFETDIFIFFTEYVAKRNAKHNVS